MGDETTWSPWHGKESMKKNGFPSVLGFCLRILLERPLIPGYKGSLISQFKDPKDEPQNSSTMESELS